MKKFWPCDHMHGFQAIWITTSKYNISFNIIHWFTAWPRAASVKSMKQASFVIHNGHGHFQAHHINTRRVLLRMPMHSSLSESFALWCEMLYLFMWWHIVIVSAFLRITLLSFVWLKFLLPFVKLRWKLSLLSCWLSCANFYLLALTRFMDLQV